MIRRRVRDGGIWRLDSLGAGILDRDPGFRYHLLPLLHLVVAPWWALSSLLLLVLAGGREALHCLS